MQDLIFTLNALLPIVFTVLIGYVLKRIGLFPSAVAKDMNRLVFRILLPVMLFLDVYEMQAITAEHLSLIGYGAALTLFVFAAALPLTSLVTRDKTRRSVLLQASFRSNYALIGMPLAIALEIPGSAGAVAMLSLVIVPLYNVLAVSSFSIFTADKSRAVVKKTLLGIAKNPIILGILAGFAALLIRALLVRLDIPFRLSGVEPVFKTLEYVGGVATPMALLSLGARFEFSSSVKLRRELVFAVLARCLVVPLAGLTVAYLFCGFSGAQFTALLAMLATPVAVSSAPMAQECGGDSDLAGQIVVWTTVLSTLTLFAAVYALKALGVF